MDAKKLVSLIRCCASTAFAKITLLYHGLLLAHCNFTVHKGVVEVDNEKIEKEVTASGAFPAIKSIIRMIAPITRQKRNICCKRLVGKAYTALASILQNLNYSNAVMYSLWTVLCGSHAKDLKNMQKT